ncbi:MAG TPA: ABC transporter permease [Saprospiraceae bacterium]|nr:ABC transporter permease [Saprospiraceae bacterium]
MIQNYLKIGVRNLLRKKFTTVINLAGLVVGMTAAMLIWQYVAFEKSYDNFHTNAGRIYRVRTDRFPQGVPDLQFAAGTACAGPLLKAQFPEVEEFVKLYPSGEKVIVNGDINFREKKVAFASAAFFNVFSYPLLSGDPQKCLNEVWTACLSESAAKRYFGLGNPIDKTFKISNGNGAFDTYRVTGVFQDMPENTHMKWDVLLSYVTFSTVKVTDGSSETAGFWDGFLTYVILKPDTDPKVLEQKIPPLLSRQFGTDFQEFKDSISFALQPLTDIHLKSHHLLEAEVNGDANAVGFLLIIGSLVLLIAWFNYINLSTAHAESRAREVGIRKAVGSSRGSLIAQFLTESSMLNVAAIGISLLLARLLMPAFEQLSGRPMPFSLVSEPRLWFSVLAVFLIGTLLAGLYPAFVLSSFRPASVLKGGVLKGKSAGGRSSISLRKVLVVAQFAASVTLIVGTIVVSRQLAHLRSTDLGLNLDKTLVIKAPSVVSAGFQQNLNTFKNEMRQVAAVRNVAASSVVPGEPFTWLAGGIRRWDAPESDSKAVKAMAIDFDFVDAYQMQLSAGRNISADIISDSNACVLNERAVSHLGLGTPAEAVGIDINFWGVRLKIVGIVKNFHQQSPKATFEPVVMRVLNGNNPPDYFSLKIEGDNLPQTLEAIRAEWVAVFPGNPFDYFFLDEHFERQYAADQRFGSVFGLFALLAIFVSCLGLFALAANMARVRTKEIGIRKVLGASVAGITSLLAKEFLKLVVVALVIASPVAYFFMNKWLTDFAYRIDIQWWMFAVAGAVAVAVAFLTVGFQSVKAALANPVKSLRSE